MKPRLLIFLVVLLLSASACQLLSSNGEQEIPNDVLFQDDFSDSSSGWDRVSEETGETNYYDGAYRIYVNDPNTDAWANPGLDFSDVHLEVEATKMNGPDDNDFGLICRAVSEEKFYFFIISSDGYYAIGKLDGENQQLISTEAMLPSEAIKQGGTTNLMRADCIGDKLSLYVNGRKVQEVHDSQYTNGDVGLIAGTFDTPGVEVHFDNFKVRKP